MDDDSPNACSDAIGVSVLRHLHFREPAGAPVDWDLVLGELLGFDEVGAVELLRRDAWAGLYAITDDETGDLWYLGMSGSSVVERLSSHARRWCGARSYTRARMWSLPLEDLPEIVEAESRLAWLLQPAFTSRGHAIDWRAAVESGFCPSFGVDPWGISLTRFQPSEP